MKKEKTGLPKMTLVGLTARTNNHNEMDPSKSKIARLTGEYWGHQMAEKIQHRSNPGKTYCVYTEYESDENGEYTYFVGEAVDSLHGQDLSAFKVIEVPESEYQKFTSSKGQIPDIVISAWQEIWSMNPSDFEGNRAYRADFEIFDERCADPNDAVVDIYIGID